MLDGNAAAQDGILADRGSGFDPHVLPDEGGSPDLRVGVDLGSLPQPDAVAHLETLDLDVNLTVQDGPVGGHVRLERPDVGPEPVADVAVHRNVLLEQGRE